MTHHTPELEAVELDGAWYVRTKPEIGTPEIVADLSMARYGKEWARLFAASIRLRASSHMARDIIAMLDAEELIPVHRITETLDALDAALADAEGRAESEQ